MRANKLKTALSRDRNIACLAPLDMFFFMDTQMSDQGFDENPLGIVLRMELGQSFPVIYSDEHGTVSGTHFLKYCCRDPTLWIPYE